MIFNAELDEETSQRLIEECKKEGISTSEFIQRACTAYISVCVISDKLKSFWKFNPSDREIDLEEDGATWFNTLPIQDFPGDEYIIGID